MISNDVLYDPSPALYRIIRFCPVYYQYSRYGVDFTVVSYGDEFIHFCVYYFFVSSLPF